MDSLRQKCSLSLPGCSCVGQIAEREGKESLTAGLLPVQCYSNFCDFLINRLLFKHFVSNVIELWVCFTKMIVKSKFDVSQWILFVILPVIIRRNWWDFFFSPLFEKI
ncbi:hypothetical protein CsSME_00022075 [Camellia sinensis var. sinensis]